MCCTQHLLIWKTKKHVVFHCCSEYDGKINCFQDLYSVHIVLWCRPWKLKGLFAISTSKTTKKGLHSQYLCTLRIPDARLIQLTLDRGSWGWGRKSGCEGGGCDTTFGPDRKTRWFSNGWLLRTRCYSVLQSHFFRVFKAKCQGFFPPKGNVTNRFDVYLYKMQLHTGADHSGNVIKRGIIKRGCS
jgi:hypothetical protein